MDLIALPFVVIPLTHKALVQCGELKLEITGDSAFEIISTIKKLASTRIEYMQLIDSLKKNDAEEVRAILEYLLENNLLVQINEDTSLEKAQLPEALFYWHLKLSEEAANQKLSLINIVIVGINTGSVLLERHLKQLGFTNVYCLSDDALDMESTKACYPKLQETIDKQALLLTADYIIAYAVFHQIIPLLSWNKYCLTHAKYFLPIVIDNTKSYIGPLVSPDSLSCFHCAHLRRLSSFTDNHLDGIKNWYHKSMAHSHGHHFSVLCQANSVIGTMLFNQALNLPSLKLNTVIETSPLGPTMVEHSILKIPHCYACISDRNKTITMNEDTLESKLAYLLDPKFGILKYVRLEQLPKPSTAFYHYLSCANNTRAFSNQKNFAYGKGVATTKKKAMLKAIGESIERYCSALYNKNHLPFSSIEAATFKTLPLDKIMSYEKDFYQSNNRIKQLTEKHRIHWAPTLNLHTGETVYVPASLIYLPYNSRDDELKIIQNISTGLASHTSYCDAAVTAICEVLERDAFMIFWRNKLPPRQITLSTLPQTLLEIVEKFSIRNLEVSLFDMTTDLGIPVIFGMLRAKKGYPILAATAACNVSSYTAIQSTLEELELVRHNIFLLSKMDGFHQAKLLEKTQVKDQKDHLLYWQNENNQHEIAFIEQSSQSISFQQIANCNLDDGKAKFDFLSMQLSNNKLDCYLADITSEDIKGLGYCVVRAIIPQAHPLAFGYGYELFNCRRLYDVPAALGINLSNVGYHRVPHPFP